jgi:hypothetical protein
MAFKKLTTKAGEQLPEDIKGEVFNVDNGDLIALNAIKQKWGFKTEAEALRFALAVMQQAENQVVYIEQGGIKVGLAPQAELLQPKDNPTNGTTNATSPSQ